MVVEDKVLVLSVSKQWFDMIVSGEKKEEYREIKTYWVTRLMDIPEDWACFFNFIPVIVKGHFIDMPKFLKYVREYTHVLFINGYGDDRPCVEKEIECITIGKPNKGWCPDEFLNKDCFIIKFK